MSIKRSSKIGIPITVLFENILKILASLNQRDPGYESGVSNRAANCYGEHLVERSMTDVMGIFKIIAELRKVKT